MTETIGLGLRVGLCRFDEELKAVNYSLRSYHILLFN